MRWNIPGSAGFSRTLAAACTGLIWVAAVAGSIGCGGGDDPKPQGAAKVAIVEYDYRFDLESRLAHATLTADIVTAGNCITLPFRAIGLDPNVTLNGEAASGAIENDQLTMCGLGWDVGARVIIDATMTVAEETWGDSQVGYSVWTDGEDAPFHYLVSWVGGCDRFGPCDNQPDVFANYRFTVTHPTGMRITCPGTITESPTETTCAFEHAGGPTYSTFGLAASPSWVESELGTWGGVQVSLFDHPSADFAANLDTAQHQAFLAWMVSKFGPYPYGDSLRFVVGPTYWNGFEHPGNIVLYDRLPKVTFSAYADPLAHTTNHEIAHQWAGDQTTLSGTYDFVWKEAMAEYLTFVFDDENQAPEIGAATPRAWKSFSQRAEFHPVPGESPALLDFYGDVYGPGPMVLFRQLEALFDRDKVMGALQMLLGRAHAIGVADVKAALETTTGVDLTGYFEAWVYGEGAPVWPRFSVTTSATGPGTIDVTVTQDNAAQGLRGCAFAVTLTGDGGETEDVWFDLGVDGMAAKTESAAVAFAVTGHTLDSVANCLAYDTAATVNASAPTVNPWRAERAPRHFGR